MASYDGFYGTTWSGSGYWFTQPDQVEVGQRNSAHGDLDRREAPRPRFRTAFSSPRTWRRWINTRFFWMATTAWSPSRIPTRRGNLLVIRDSYAHCFSTFLASDHQNIYLVDLRYYRDNLSQFVAEHPVDRVLYSMGWTTWSATPIPLG